MIQVMALPDWRAGNNYQCSLGRALAAEGFEVVYPQGYRRGLPLARAHYGAAALLHLHWPEPYFENQADGFRWWRRLRFPLDLKLAAWRRPLIYTAHNFLPHDRADRAVLRRNYRSILATAAGIIAHSPAAANRLAEFLPAASPAIHVVPHGDAAEYFPTPPSRAEARQRLRLDATEPVVLMFGRAEPYKGLEEIVAAWPRLRSPARLWIAGAPQSAAFARTLQDFADPAMRVTFELNRLTDVELSVRLAAADVVLFNYRQIFTSGAGSLARSLGRRIILPARLDTVDLMEPAATVFRFRAIDGDLPEILAQALATPDDPIGTATWREATSWRNVARKTAAIYRGALS